MSEYQLGIRVVFDILETLCEFNKKPSLFKNNIFFGQYIHT